MEEIIRQIQMAHQGDKAARDRLVTENTGLVWSIVRRYAGRGYELEDLFQIGSIGLMKAIDKFDTAFDVKFSTYAVPMIAGEIRRFLRDDGMIKVSRSVKELGFKARSAREEIAGKIGASSEEVAASLEAGAEVESLYKPLRNGGEKELLLMDRIEEERDGHEELLNRMVLKELMDGLSEQHKEIILRRYFGSQTQTQVAEALHISQVQVSRLEKRILKEMRRQYEEGGNGKGRKKRV